MLLQKIVIEGIMPERALSKLQREGICVYHAKKLKKNQILFRVNEKDAEKVFAIGALAYNAFAFIVAPIIGVSVDAIETVADKDKAEVPDPGKPRFPPKRRALNSVEGGRFIYV